MARDNYRNSRTDEELRKFAPDIHAATTISHLARLTQDGKTFILLDTVLDLAIGATEDYLIFVNPQLGMHITGLSIGLTGGDARFELWENVSVDIEGTPILSVPMNRRINEPSDTAFQKGATWSSGGLLLAASIFPKDSRYDVTGGGELILPKVAGEDYVLRMQNVDSAAPLSYSLALRFYEPSYEL